MRDKPNSERKTIDVPSEEALRTLRRQEFVETQVLAWAGLLLVAGVTILLGGMEGVSEFLAASLASPWKEIALFAYVGFGGACLANVWPISALLARN